MGYTVERTSNAEPGLYAQSQIVAADENDQRAKDLAEQLGGLPVTSNPSLDENTFVVVAYDDYTGPSDEAAQAAEPAESAASDQVGTPGSDLGTAMVSPEIDAGGDGPRCVN